jgi:AcrR family transcriptional regulator
MPGPALARTRGRPAKATRADAVTLARADYLTGRRVEMRSVAIRLGVGRSTIHGWFGSRRQLVAEVLAGEFDGLVTAARSAVPQTGALGLLRTLELINHRLATSEPLRRLLEREREGALRLLTSPAAGVQPRAMAAIRRLIDDEVTAHQFQPPARSETLARAIIRLGEAFIYNDALSGIRGDTAELFEIEAALLGIPETAPAPP